MISFVNQIRDNLCGPEVAVGGWVAYNKGPFGPVVCWVSCGSKATVCQALFNLLS